MQDSSVPIVSMRFDFDAGSSFDPANRPGLSAMLSNILTKGAGDLDEQSFQRQLNDRSISMDFSAYSDNFYGSLDHLLNIGSCPGIRDQRNKDQRTENCGSDKSDHWLNSASCAFSALGGMRMPVTTSSSLKTSRATALTISVVTAAIRCGHASTSSSV